MGCCRESAGAGSCLRKEVAYGTTSTSSSPPSHIPLYVYSREVGDIEGENASLCGTHINYFKGHGKARGFSTKNGEFCCRLNIETPVRPMDCLLQPPISKT